MWFKMQKTYYDLNQLFFNQATSNIAKEIYSCNTKNIAPNFLQPNTGNLYQLSN